MDGRGGVLARLSREEGGGVVVADIPLDRLAEEPGAIPGSFWKAEYAEAICRRWERCGRPGEALGYAPARKPFRAG